MQSINLEHDENIKKSFDFIYAVATTMDIDIICTNLGTYDASLNQKLDENTKQVYVANRINQINFMYK